MNAKQIDKELTEAIMEFDEWVAGSIGTNNEQLDIRQKELIELTNEDSAVGSSKRSMTNEEISERLLSKEEIGELLDAANEFIAEDEAKIKGNEGECMAKEVIERIATARVNYKDPEPTITISTEVAGKIVRLLSRVGSNE